MKTKTDYEPDRKKGKGRISKIAEFTVSITDSMSERFKVSGSGGRPGETLLDLRRDPELRRWPGEWLGQGKAPSIWADPSHARPPCGLKNFFMFQNDHRLLGFNNGENPPLNFPLDKGHAYQTETST